MAGLVALLACIPLIHFTLGLGLIFGGLGENEPVLGAMGAFFALIAGIIILVGWGIAFMIFLAGKNLGRQTKYQLCTVGAAILCIFMPIGTILGVVTLVTLQDESVKALFNGEKAVSSDLQVDSKPLE
jgi:hypothetical protein